MVSQPPPTTLDADDIIALLGLQRHREGGWYRETFRDPEISGDDARARSTAIYFLLKAGEVSRWHRIDAAELWHWYGGAALALSIAAGAGQSRTVILGQDLSAGQRPQAIVPAGRWQQARTSGAWTLAGCTVAPGFAFDSFELAPDGFEPAAGARD